MLTTATKTARHNHFILFISLLFVAILSIPQSANAADLYLKFDGVDGESKSDAKHDKWIDVLSTDWGTQAQKAQIKGQHLMIQTRSGNRKAKNGQYTLRDGRVVSVKNGRIVKQKPAGAKSMKPVRTTSKPKAAQKGNVETEFKVEKGQK